MCYMDIRQKTPVNHRWKMPHLCHMMRFAMPLCCEQLCNCAVPPLTAPKLRAPHARLLSVLKAEIRTEDDHLSPHPDSLACAASLWITAPPRSPTAAPPLLLPSSSILSSPITSTLSLCSSLPTWPALPAFVSCIDGDQLLPTCPQCCVTSLEMGR